MRTDVVLSFQRLSVKKVVQVLFVDHEILIDGKDKQLNDQQN
jgi:hypothetical protein